MVASDSREAYARLQQEAVVTALSPLRETGDGGSEFEFDLLTPAPNTEGLPPTVRFRAMLPKAFPMLKAKVFLADKELWRFPHMELRSGLICLGIGQPHHWDPFDSLFNTLMETLDWIEDASRGTLLQSTAQWEFPDFRVEPFHPPIPLPVWSMESPSTFESWRNRIGQHGEVILRLQAKGKGLVPVKFSQAGVDEITSPQPSPSFLDDKTVQLRGKWLILPNLVHSFHRPPRTFNELAGMCSSVGFEFWDALVAGDKSDAFLGRHYILIGAPIPAKLGEEPKELHWQPIVMPTKWLESTKHDRGGSPKRQWLRDLLGNLAIPWGEAENISMERLEARGRLAEEALCKRICVIGCGAIGSVLVDLFVRGGICDLALFDPEILEPGNLCRHTLAPSDVDQSKSHALVEKLRGINPGIDIRGYAAKFPLPPPNGVGKEWRELLNADAWVDCTAHEATFVWLSHQGRARGKRVIHLFTNPHAKMLTLCASGKHASCSEVYRMLAEDIGKGNAPFSMGEYFPKCDEVPLGAGCWHPAFPAVGSDIHSLVASAIPGLAELLGSQWTSQGTAVVMRRNDFHFSQPNAGPTPLIEVVWNRQYRGSSK